MHSLGLVFVLALRRVFCFFFGSVGGVKSEGGGSMPMLAEWEQQLIIVANAMSDGG